MKLTKVTAIAAFVLSIAAGSALAADASGAQTDTNAMAPKNGAFGTLGVDMGLAGKDAMSNKKYYGTLSPDQQAGVTKMCAGDMSAMTDAEKNFCASVK